MSGGRVDRKCSLAKPVTQASASFADVNLVAGATFDEVCNIVNGACMFTMDSNTTSRGVNSGVHKGIASRPATIMERTPAFCSSSRVIEVTPD